MGVIRCGPAIALFEHVRDIPYYYPSTRDPSEVLESGRGSCSGKHYLLGEMFRLLGLDVRHMICTHRFNESPIVFPGPMQEMLRKNEIVDMHDYLQIAVDGAVGRRRRHVAERVARVRLPGERELGRQAAPCC